MKDKYPIIFSLNEIIEAERIISDKDEKEALKFMNNVFKKKILEATKEKWKPVFELRGANIPEFRYWLKVSWRLVKVS